MADDFGWLFDFDSTAGDLERRIYHRLREAVFDGRLKPGTRLPATRRLATELGVSRGTVVAAFEQLAAEGYVVSQTGRGTLVAELPEQELETARAAKAGTRPAPEPSKRARPFGRAGSSSPPWPRCFRSGIPSLEDFPQREWGRCLAARARTIRSADMAYHNAAGLPLLQEALIDHLARVRGVVAEPSQIIVVPSAQAAFDTAVLCTTDPGDVVAVEDPGYQATRHVAEAAGASILPCPVDDDGIVARGLAETARLRLIAVTPSHQYPTSVTMSLQRRLELLDIAHASGAFILEDDYDSEFRYAERPIAALQGLDGGARVIYVGTFSKTLAPGIRAAYMVAPPNLAPMIADTAVSLGQVVSHPVQGALADFINDGYFTAHIGRMRPRYAEKRDRLVDTLRGLLPREVHVDRPRGGLQLLMRLPEGSDDRALTAALAGDDIVAAPLSALSAKAVGQGLLLGFALPKLDEIAPAATRLAEVVQAHIAS